MPIYSQKVGLNLKIITILLVHLELEDHDDGSHLRTLYVFIPNVFLFKKYAAAFDSNLLHLYLFCFLYILQSNEIDNT